ncbi:MAG: hypothetical protein PVF34_10080 [Gammaproteobacteria bacterium]|jgi:hypothetical protein
MLPKQDIAWWYWLATIPLLTVGNLGETNGYVLAGLLTALQIVHFTYREHSIRAFPVQVRIAYLGWFLAGQLPYMQWMLWVQLIGTSLSVLVDYCPMARLMALVPWNRQHPLTMELVMKVFFSPPVKGSILNHC